MPRPGRPSIALLLSACVAVVALLSSAAAALSEPAEATRLSAAAASLKRNGQRELALDRARQALEADPGNREAHWVAAWALAELGRKDEAAAEFGAFVKAAPGDYRLAEARAALTRLGAAADRPISGAPGGGAAAAEAALEALLSGAPVKGIPERLGGGVMVKYKLRLEDGSAKGLKAVFKPHQKSPQSYVYEMVAYRLSRLCRMGFVPVTVKRDLPRGLLAQVSGGGFARLLCSGDRVTGSLQQWVNEAKDPLGSGARAWAVQWLGRLAKPGAALPDRAAARQLGSMFLLDYLQSNGDRYTGGNVLQDASGKYWFIDNSEGFSSAPQPRRDFERLVRFDRTVTDALRAATPAQITGEVGGLLSKAKLKGLLERRQHALVWVEAAVKRYGADKAYL